MVGAGVAIAVGIGAYVMLRPSTSPPPPAEIASPTPPPSASPVPVSAAPAAPATPAPASAATDDDCVVPGPTPILPRAEVASADDMKIQHDAIQAFVLALEHYEECYQRKIETAPPQVDAQTKDRWAAEGNRALDVAHKLADAFSDRLKTYKALHPNAPPIK